jgi:hypothetical protein
MTSREIVLAARSCAVTIVLSRMAHPEKKMVTKDCKITISWGRGMQAAGTTDRQRELSNSTCLERGEGVMLRSSGRRENSEAHQ